MRIVVVTLFEPMFQAISEHGVTGRAVKQGLIELSFINPRDFAYDRHRTVDDRPFGGGPGMLMKYQPLKDALLKAKQQLPGARVIYLSPQGQKFDQAAAGQLSACPDLILLCGRYEGIDERVIQAFVDEEWSIGDFVLSGGEMAAMVMIDAIGRLIPGVLGHEQSAEQDSFSQGLLDCPHYTRPEEIDGMAVPAVLCSGNHKAIRDWRMQQALGRTFLRRPELLTTMTLDKHQRALLNEFKQAQPSSVELHNDFEEPQI